MLLVARIVTFCRWYTQTVRNRRILRPPQHTSTRRSETQDSIACDQPTCNKMTQHAPLWDHSSSGSLPRYHTRSPRPPDSWLTSLRPDDPRSLRPWSTVPCRMKLQRTTDLVTNAMEILSIAFTCNARMLTPTGDVRHRVEEVVLDCAVLRGPVSSIRRSHDRRDSSHRN